MVESVLVHVDRSTEVGVVELSGPRGNALSEAGLRELAAAFAAFEAAGAPPLVLAARGRSFCTGLDLDLALEADREAMRRLMSAFHAGLRACALYPGAVIAAIEGHALAGGALLALACTRRVMTQEGARFGVHGVQLGVSYPQVAIEIARDRLPRPSAERLLYSGVVGDAAHARRWGWIDEEVESGRVRDRAHAFALEHGRGSRRATAAAARMSAAVLRDRLEGIDEDGMRRWLDQWFAQTTRERLHAARAARRARRTSGPDPADPRGGPT